MMAINVIIATLGITLTTSTIYLLSKIWPNNNGLKSDDSKTKNRVLFFPDHEFPCNRLILGIKSEFESNCPNPSCRKLHGRPGEPPSSMIEFLRLLASAKDSIDLCIFLLTQTTLADTLQDLHGGLVKIRIITDSSEDDTSASKLDRLSRAGIQIKSNRKGTGALMHHKFVIIDNKLLLTGSFNWTSKAVVSNYEAVLVTSEEDLVSPFRVQFEEMWRRFGEHSVGRRSIRPKRP